MDKKVLEIIRDWKESTDVNAGDQQMNAVADAARTAEGKKILESDVTPATVKAFGELIEKHLNWQKLTEK